MANRRKVRVLRGKALEREVCLHGTVPYRSLDMDDLTPDECFDRAIALIDSYDEKYGLIEQVTAKQGRPREVPWRAFLILLQYHFIWCTMTGKLTEVRQSIRLIRHRHAEIGIERERVKYEHIESYLEDFRRVLEPSDSPHRFDEQGTSKGWRDVGLDLDEMTTRYLVNSVDERFHSPEFGLDATHFPAWARAFSLRERVESDDPEIDDTYKTVSKKGHDGRPQWGKDKDARLGEYTNTKAGAKKGDNIEHGFGLEVMTMLPEMGDPSLPPFSIALGVRPMGTWDQPQLLKMIDTLGDAGRPVKHIVFDKGYSDKRDLPEELLERGITKSMDHNDNQLGHIPFDGETAVPNSVMWIDGQPYPKGTPEDLWEIGSISQLVKGKTKKHRLKKYQLRSAYSFVNKTKLKKTADGWVQQMKGPALAGKVQCRNYAPSMSSDADAEKPLTDCEQGVPCMCGKSITVPPRFLAVRQREVYGTDHWKADYGRRSLIESAHSQFKGHTSNIQRGFTRVFGRVKNAILVMMALAGVNIIMARRWTAKRLQQDPWTAKTGAPEHWFDPKLEAKKRAPKPARHRYLQYDLTGSNIKIDHEMEVDEA